MEGGSGGGLEEFIRKQTEISNSLSNLSSTFKNMNNGLLSISSQLNDPFSYMNKSLLNYDNQFRLSNLIPEHPLKELQNNFSSFTDSVGSLNNFLRGFTPANNIQIPKIGGLNGLLENSKLSNLFTDINNIGSNGGLGGLNNLLRELTSESHFNNLKGFKGIGNNSLNNSIEDLSVYLDSVDDEDKEVVGDFIASTSIALQHAQRNNDINLFLIELRQIILDISQKYNNLPKPVKGILYLIFSFYFNSLLSSAPATEEQVNRVELKIDHNTEVLEDVKVSQEKIAKSLDSLNRILGSSLYYSDVNVVAIAEKRVHLREEPNRHSKSIMVIPIGQEVTVLAKEFKWIYISMETSDNTVIKGWTYAQYYK
jgi:hypothetical protein